MDHIEQEARRIITKSTMSLVEQKGHVTNWTKPYGYAVQYSLYNTSGDTSDFSTDHNLTQKSNEGNADKFFIDPSLSNTFRLFRIFKDNVINFRLNGMGRNSGLSPHKEYNIHERRYRIRLHLPVITNDGAWMMLGGKKYRYRRGYIYFFNNGLVHAAGNDGEDVRYHFVWDNWLDERFFENILDLDNSKSPDPQIVDKLTKQESVELSRTEPYRFERYEDQFSGTVQVKAFD